MLSQMLRRTVERDPGKTAVVQGRTRIRYAELETLVARCAGGLQRLGIEPGACVAVALPNGVEFVAALFACARVQAVMLPIDANYAPPEMAQLAADARARIVITDGAGGSLPVNANTTVMAFASLLRDEVAPLPGEVFNGPALYLYTSGSTEVRKRLCFTQENLFYEAHNFVETVGLSAEDTILGTIPLHHSYGLGNCLLDAMYTGSTLVLLEPHDVPFAARCERVLELLGEERIRFYPGVPYQFQMLAALPDAPRSAMQNLKLCISSGDVLPRQTYEQFLERFGCPIRSLYGSTEAGSISIDMDPAETLQFGSLGSPLRNVDIRILESSGRAVSPGEIGEIWVKSPAMPPNGYDNRPELTAKAFKDGYYNTGDIGRMDARGHLVMTGRKQTFVDVGGHKVDITEVEEVLMSHPQVREAAALGVEVPDLGTLIKVAVVTHDGCDEESIRSYCRERLPAFKIPRFIEFRAELPRNAIGKVLKSELMDIGAELTSASLYDFKGASQKISGKSGDEEGAQVEILAAQIRDQVAMCLQSEPASISRTASFQSMGFDSLRATELHQRLVTLTGLPLSITMLWNYPNIDALALALSARINAQSNGQSLRAAEGVSAIKPETDLAPLLNEPVDAMQQATDLDRLLNEIDRLSDSEIDTLLRGK